MKNIYKQYTLYIIITTLLLLLCTGIFNFTVDSAEIIKPSNGVSFAAKAIATGHNVAGLENYDERLFQKQVFNNFITYPDCIIIGSSRTMMIQSDMIKDAKKVFNHSVSGAFLEDYIAIIGMYSKKNVLPKKIIIGADPWIFNSYNGPSCSVSLTKEYQHMVRKINKKDSQKVIKNQKKENKYFQLINFENTKNNFLHIKKADKIFITSNENINVGIKRSDGSIRYPSKIRYQTDEETKKKAREYTIKPIYNVENYKELSNLKIFENFINYLTMQGTEVVFFLPPYHPIVYSYFKKHYEYKNILKSEDYLRTFARKNHLKLYGSYDPVKYDFSSTDFTDGMHGKAVISQKILSLIVQEKHTTYPASLNHVSSHYKKELGDIVLDRMYDGNFQSEKVIRISALNLQVKISKCIYPNFAQIEKNGN